METFLFDQFGNEIKPERKPDGRVLAVASIEDRYGVYPSQGLTPKKLAAVFKEANAGDPWRQAQLFEEMEEKDGHLSSLLRKRRGAVSGLDYEVVPFSQDKRGIEVKDFVEEVITGLPDFEDNLKDMADAIGKGYSALELHWALRNSRHVVRHMQYVEPRRFTWINSLEPRLITRDALDGIPLVPFKFLFHQHKTRSGAATRQGVLRVCAWMYLFKNYGVKDWVQFAEVFGLPLRIGKYEPGATADDKAALVKAVRSLGSDAAGIISKSTEIEFVEAVKGASGDLYEKLAAFCNDEMSKAVLGQTLTTQQGDNGARSLGEVHKKVEEGIQRDDCEQVSKSLRRDLIRPLVGFNFGWDVPLPWFKLHYEEPGDLKAEAERYGIHIRDGADVGKDHYREKFRLPKPKDGEEIMRLPGGQSPQPPLQGGVASAKARGFAACPGCGERVITASQVGGGGDLLDPMVERLLGEADLKAFIDPIQKLMDEASSLEDFRDQLLDVYQDMPPVELGNLMQRAFAAAELAGRFDSIKG